MDFETNEETKYEDKLSLTRDKGIQKKILRSDPTIQFKYNIDNCNLEK